MYILTSTHTYIVFLICEFFKPALPDGFHCSLNYKSPQASRTFFSILADLNNTLVWMGSTHTLISKYSSPCTNTLMTVSSERITIGIIVTFTFHIFFQFSSYLSHFSLFFRCTVLLAGTAKCTIQQVLYYFR